MQVSCPNCHHQFTVCKEEVKQISQYAQTGVQEEFPKLDSNSAISSLQQDHTYASQKTELEGILEKQSKVLDLEIKNHLKTIQKLQKQLAELEQKPVLGRGSFVGVSAALFENKVRNQDLVGKAKRFSCEVKKFSATINYLSPRAYKFIRSCLDLPTQRSLRYWSSSVQCNPGFFLDVLKELKQAIRKDRMKKDLVLIIDGMHIKKGIAYKTSTEQYEGLCDYGPDFEVPEQMKTVEAAEGLVFLVNSLRSRYKVPISYFLISGIKSQMLAKMIKHALHLLFAHDSLVKIITNDGAPTNISAMCLLGCKWDEDEVDGFLSVEHTQGHTVYWALDACHLLKLARNAVGDLQVMYDGEGNKISWHLIDLLNEVQKREGLVLGNKLGQKHINYKKNCMKVSLAGQTLSNSVADAITYCHQCKEPGFCDIKGTVQFIKIINDIFDMLNSKSRFGKGTKRPLKKKWMVYWKNDVKMFTEYLNGLKDSAGQSMKSHGKKTFVRGMMLALKTLDALATDLLTRDSDPYAYFLSFKMSQDALETLFRCIRSRCGCNNNPTAQQFRFNLRSILLQNSIQSSEYGNVLEFEESATVSVFRLKQPAKTQQQQPDSIIWDDPNKLSDFLNKIQSMELSNIQENVLGHVGGYVARNIIQKVDCVFCCEALLQNPSENPSSYSFFQLLVNKQRGGLLVPSHTVLNIMRSAEKAFRVAISETKSKITSDSHLALKLHRLILEYQGSSRIQFPNFGDHDLDMASSDKDLHSTQLTKLVIKEYVRIRLKTYGKRFHESVIKSNVLGKRQKLNKSIIFQNL